MIKKQLYIIPETEVLEVRFEENIMSAKLGVAGAAGASDDYNIYDEDF